jgi:hypothetical protein
MARLNQEDSHIWYAITVQIRHVCASCLKGLACAAFGQVCGSCSFRDALVALAKALLADWLSLLKEQSQWIDCRTGPGNAGRSKETGSKAMTVW